MADTGFQNIYTTNEFASWQRGATVNQQYTYSFINNSAFYASLPMYIRPFMQRQVQQWLWWYDGYVPFFHKEDNGIMSTRLATSLVNKITKKVFGSRLLLKNAGKQVDNVNPNESLKKMCDWADDVKLERTLRKGCTFAGAGGFAMLKTNKDAKGNLWVESVRADRFVSNIDASTGKIRACDFYLLTTADTKNDDTASVYFLLERRYFGDYKPVGEEVKHDVPLVEYSVFRAIGSVINNNGVMAMHEKGREHIPFKTLPKNVKRAILDSYGALVFDIPTVLPFEDLGCDLLCWTDGVSGLPELPYGEGIVSTILPYLQEYDVINSSMISDIYLGRGRVLVDAGMINANSIDGVANWDAGLDAMIYTKIPGTGEEGKPVSIQFELRSEEWKKERDTILENIAVNIGISTSTIGSFMQDGTARTAREVSAEENETVAYVADCRGRLEKPINDMLDRVRLFMGLADKVEIRWTQANLSNPYMVTEMKAQQINAGLTSIEDAIAELNPDDDEEQLAKKVARAKEDYKERGGQTLAFKDDESDVMYQ